MDKEENIRIINDTLDIIDNGFYYFEGEERKLNLSKREMKKCFVFLPEDIEKKKSKRKKSSEEKKHNYSCENIDSFSLAEREIKGGKEKILVLNMASATNPGGNVRGGTKSQEEDLCRRSTLLASLESSKGKKYYEYNRNLKSFLYSDSIIVSPNVEVFKDEKGNPLKESFTVSVITCAAPNLKRQPLSALGYENIMIKRIDGLLAVAEDMGYKNLILGAWGCGVFGGNPEIVSRAFRKELDSYSGFDSAKFAILHKKENYEAFIKRFPPA